MRLPAGRGPLLWTATALALVAVFLGFALSGAIASSGTTRSQAAAALSEDVLSSPGQALSLPEKDARTVAWAVVDGVRHGDITVKTGRLLVAELRPLLGPAGPGSVSARREQFDRLAETFFTDLLDRQIVVTTEVAELKMDLGALAASLA